MNRTTTTLILLATILAACTQTLPGSTNAGLPDMCMVQTDFTCENWNVNNNEITLTLTNYIPTDMTTAEFTFESEDCEPNTQTIPLGAIGGRETRDITVTCTNDLSGSVDAEFSISYVRQGESETHVAKGSLHVTA